ncbi:MAG: hypothetical protein ACFFE4_03360 [Candidatus Thorarchaeota archaeon]
MFEWAPDELVNVGQMIREEEFNKFYKLNQEIQIKDFPSLEPIIREVFIDKSIQLT